MAILVHNADWISNVIAPGKILSKGSIYSNHFPYAGDNGKEVWKLESRKVTQTTVTDFARFLGRSTFTPF